MLSSVTALSVKKLLSGGSLSLSSTHMTASTSQSRHAAARRTRSLSWVMSRCSRSTSASSWWLRAKIHDFSISVEKNSHRLIGRRRSYTSPDMFCSLVITSPKTKSPARACEPILLPIIVASAASMALLRSSWKDTRSWNSKTCVAMSALT